MSFSSSLLPLRLEYDSLRFTTSVWAWRSRKHPPTGPAVPHTHLVVSAGHGFRRCGRHVVHGLGAAVLRIHVHAKHIQKNFEEAGVCVCASLACSEEQGLHLYSHPPFSSCRPRKRSCSGWSVAAWWWWASQEWVWPLVATVCLLSGSWVGNSSTASYSRSSSVCCMLASLMLMAWLLGMWWGCCCVFSAVSHHLGSLLWCCTHGRGRRMGWSYSTFLSGPLPWFALWYVLSGYRSWWISSSVAT